jgi:hypothetical protein
LGEEWLHKIVLTRLLLIPMISGIVVLAAIGLVWLITPRATGNVVGAAVSSATAFPPIATRPAASPAAPQPALAGAVTPNPARATPTAAAAVLTTGSFLPAALVQPISTAQPELRTGQIEAALDDQSGDRMSIHIRFDLGDQQHAPRLQSTSTYTSAAGIRADEWILIGERAWQRQIGGGWTASPRKKDILEQIRAFLPPLTTAQNLVLEDSDDESTTTLYWYDADTNAAITLQLDAATGTPRTLRMATHGSGALLVVTYRSWNTPVEIDMPAAE